MGCAGLIDGICEGEEESMVHAGCPRQLDILPAVFAWNRRSERSCLESEIPSIA